MFLPPPLLHFVLLCFCSNNKHIWLDGRTLRERARAATMAENLRLEFHRPEAAKFPRLRTSDARCPFSDCMTFCTEMFFIQLPPTILKAVQRKQRIASSSSLHFAPWSLTGPLVSSPVRSRALFPRPTLLLHSMRSSSFTRRRTNS